MNGQTAAYLRSLRQYVFLPNADHVLFGLAVAVSAQLDGDPLWGMLVGAPSSGKTEAIRSLDDVADDHVTEITAAGLLSWTPGKNARPTGLLARLGDTHAFATIADFSTVLASSDRGQRDQLFALLRRAYDGEVTREMGTAPEPLRWHGRLTLLAGVTPAVDNYSAHADALGPRWLYIRLQEASKDDRQRAAQMTRESQAKLKEHRARSRQLARAAVEEAIPHARGASLPERLSRALDEAAMVTCLGRAAVQREGYGRREITSLPTIEEPPRLIGQLTHLARGLLGLGLDEEETLHLCQRVALDSMPASRRRALEALALAHANGEEPPTAELARRMGADRKVAKFALEELAAIGVCRWRGDEGDDEEPNKQQKKCWRLDGENTELIADVLGAEVVGRKVGTTHHSPHYLEGVPHTSSHAADTSETAQHRASAPLPTPAEESDPTDELLGVKDVLRLGIKGLKHRQQLKRLRESEGADRFPDPDVDIPGNPLWLRSTVEEWARANGRLGE